LYNNSLIGIDRYIIIGLIQSLYYYAYEGTSITICLVNLKTVTEKISN